MFADMYPSANGRPSMPPRILAAAITLQALHGLSDFETVQELRCDLRWKAACGLGLHDMAFDPSLLAYFRRRLSRFARPNRVFEAVREVVKATGVLKGKHRRAMDSTVLDDAVATQDTVTQIIAAVRAVIREVPGAGTIAAAQCSAHDYNGPGKPRMAWNDEQARAQLIDALVSDALRLLGHLPEQELGEKAAIAVGTLALVAGQDVEPAEDSDGRDGRWRITRGTAPGRMVSTVDPKPGTCTRPALTGRTATRPTWPPSPRPAYIQPSPCGPGPAPSTMRPPSALTCLPTRTSRWTPSGTPPTPPARSATPCSRPGTGCSSSRLRYGPPSPAVSPSTTSTSTPQPPP